MEDTTNKMIPMLTAPFFKGLVVSVGNLIASKDSGKEKA